jgi:hypothetical protein
MAGMTTMGQVCRWPLVRWQALRAQPLIRPDGLTLGALAGLLAAAGTAAVLATRRRAVPAVA